MACIPWEGRETDYQQAAHDAHFVETGRSQLPWTSVTTTCDTPCLNVDHMKMVAPASLAYPRGVCVYCGFPSNTRDHLLPVTSSGETLRRRVLTVPACGECNSAISDKGGHTISERRAIAHDHLRRKHKALLAVKDRTPSELEEYGPNLRAHIIKNMETRRAIHSRLEWPHDPDYDERAFQRSGIPMDRIAALT